MAYPDYSTNLPGAAALADEVIPFMKFFASVPRMFAFTVQQHPYILMANMALAKGMVLGANAAWGSEYYAENDYFPIPFTDSAKYVGSMSNYDFHLPTGVDSRMVENGLGWWMPSNIDPFTHRYN